MSVLGCVIDAVVASLSLLLRCCVAVAFAIVVLLLCVGSLLVRGSYARLRFVKIGRHSVALGEWETPEGYGARMGSTRKVRSSSGRHPKGTELERETPKKYGARIGNTRKVRSQNGKHPKGTEVEWEGPEPGRF